MTLNSISGTISGTITEAQGLCKLPSYSAKHNLMFAQQKTMKVIIHKMQITIRSLSSSEHMG